jgi:hypothetical protein
VVGYTTPFDFFLKKTGLYMDERLKRRLKVKKGGT